MSRKRRTFRRNSKEDEGGGRQRVILGEDECEEKNELSEAETKRLEVFLLLRSPVIRA